jgi:nucleotide-binding universal stress UspA family protein
LSNLKAKISKVLAAIDGSELSIDAADYAVLIAKQNNAQLIALHVIRSEEANQYASNLTEVVTPTSVDSMVQTVKQDSQKWFDPIEQKSNANNVQVKTDIIVSPNSTA